MLKNKIIKSEFKKIKIGRNLWRNLIKSIILVIFILLSLLTSLFYVSGLFINNPEINPGITTIYTDQDLECRWMIDVSTESNVTWYVNNVVNKTYSRMCNAGIECLTEGAGNIPQSLTVKGQSWTCSVVYFNGTSLEEKNDTITIQDSVPTIPLIYFENGTQINNGTIVEISEDSTTMFILNSTDADNDVIIYTLQSNTANCSINPVTGYITCMPYDESHVGLKELRFRSEDSISGATRGYVNLTLNVTPNNDPPYFSPALTYQHVYEGQPLNYVIHGSDPENDVPFTFFIQSDLSSLIIVQLNSTSAEIRFNNSGMNLAQFNDKGNHTITVIINDSGTPIRGNQSSFILEVTPINHKPNMTITVINPDSLIQGSSLTILVNATDLDNDTITFSTSNIQLYNITYSSTNKSDPSGVSFANATIHVDVLTNDHVINRNITISAFDGKENYSINILLNITNVNDAPIIHDISTAPINTLNNSNISNLTAYTGVLFRYAVNATDIDKLTYAGDNLTYYSNDTNFNIDNVSGVLSFISNQVGTYYVSINVTDSGGLSDEKTAIINIYPNTNPYFNGSLVFNCAEYDPDNYPFNCSLNLSNYVGDADLGDYVSNFWTNSTIFSINESTGIISFVANQSMLGNYSILVNITDSRGGMNSTIMQLLINNTNNKPVMVETSAPSGRIIVGDSYTYGIIANDSDLYLNNSYENLSFNYSVVGPNASIFSIEKVSDNSAVLRINPTTPQHAGSYNVTITVYDYYNNMTNTTINIFVYNITSPPNITMITPFGTPINSDSVNTSWINTSQVGLNTTITIYENTTYLFNHTTTYDISYPNFLNYKWYYDGSLVGTSYEYSKYFDFFSSGNHNITLIVTDDFNKSASFNWNIVIINVNRPVVLINPLTNLTGLNAVNGTTTYSNYMTYYSSQVKFYDPDDDINTNGVVESSENTIIYSVTSCPYAAFTFINNSLKVQSLSIGSCIVNFTATDSMNNSINVTSYDVLVNVTYVSNETIPQVVPVTNRGGGGGASRTVTIPIPEEIEKPKPLEIITPKLVTIYRNATVVVPIVLNNTWNDTLEGVTLTAQTNASNVSISLDRTYFSRIFKNKTEEVTLTISNYKSEGHYEIQVKANVVNPDFTDTATIYVNSADTSSEGETLDTKISFARDLLSSNPECQELTELLNQAKRELSLNNYEGTAKLVDSVINGCKYLVSSKSQVEKPSRDVIKRFVWKEKYNEYIVVGVFVVLFFAALVYIIRRDKEQEV
ncbi:MAG: hypothetical protein KatS3mg002_0805 [Candidatus Woesearchaeota archaeon]|nr:MAG: hypothetical protein KatS3mg002_0805 [Candidatus Woesearchaeota archaeon]